MKNLNETNQEAFENSGHWMTQQELETFKPELQEPNGQYYSCGANCCGHEEYRTKQGTIKHLADCPAQTNDFEF